MQTPKGVRRESVTVDGIPWLPPLLIQVGTREVLLDDSKRFAERAREAGVEVDLEVWDGMFHVWHFNCGRMPESNDAVRKIGSYCREKMKPQ